MATKGDLIEAQNFSRRRLLSAFVSGAPGGKELEPATPLRAVIAAIALTALVVLIGVFYGFIRPGLPQGWENGKLVLVSDTGARFVTVDGVLHPVINTASARLLLPSSEFDVISTDQASLAGTPIGATLGIVGAPDELPSPGGLVNAGWTACVAEDAALEVRIGGEARVAAADDRSAVVESDDILYVVSGERSFAITATDSDAVLRAAGITALDPTIVPAEWLNLFTPASALTPLVVEDVGERLAGTDLRIGDVVHVAGTPDDERLLVQPEGSLAALSPLAWQLYQLGSGKALGGEVREVSASDVAGLETATRPAGAEDWPTVGFPTIDADDRPCAQLESAGDGRTRTALAVHRADADIVEGVSVEPGAGAVVRAGGRGDQSTRLLTLVDATGTAYPVPGATEETLARLGYAADEVGEIGDEWTALLPTGPALSEEAAGRSPAASADAEDR
ncbi:MULTISPECIES: type VII secretion protein EccB [unclassified Microbacterium]|uniref:type VII secretion protein EccB n=1 Tax=unclassified Microbacterium TaxID=2609290 RepID=UPI00214AF287|nr:MULTISPECIES: type VII secretion protein EccB [unclassified Microbacterium]MCR2784672.1 type VII secretion protein EccB [Microbacterium sp. zg.B96]WIM16213.1 type VII secretion protein EccB [Microbacterium sp. zg-B96]